MSTIEARRGRALLRLLLFAFAALLLQAAPAAVPHEDAVPAYAEEQTILQREDHLPEPGWWSLRSGRNHFERNYLVPLGLDAEQDLILQRGGNTWRVLRNGPVATIAGILLLVVPLAIFGFWRLVGPMRHEEPDTGRTIVRFTGWQRLVHWATAISFIVLAVTGLLIFFGKQLLIPLIGHTAFSWVAIVSKYLHNFVGPLFVVCSVLMFFTFVRENRFRRGDWEWIKRGGGMVSHQHVPAGYFNAGEKVWFWFGVVLLGLVVSVTGLILDFINFRPTRYLLQWADILHITAATLYMAATMGHIYIGTLGTPGAYGAMRHGTVDESWAKAHHRHWYEEVKRRPPAPAEPAQAPARGLRGSSS